MISRKFRRKYWNFPMKQLQSSCFGHAMLLLCSKMKQKQRVWQYDRSDRTDFKSVRQFSILCRSLARYFCSFCFDLILKRTLFLLESLRPDTIKWFGEYSEKIENHSSAAWKLSFKQNNSLSSENRRQLTKISRKDAYNAQSCKQMREVNQMVTV